MAKETSDTIGKVIVALVLVFFYLFGFFLPQTCGIDRDSLYCQLHPITALDIIGTILFTAGALVVGGFMGLPFYGTRSDERKQIAVPAIAIILGIILIFV